MIEKLGLIMLFILTTIFVNGQQQYTGYNTDNFAGFTKVYNQPAEIVGTTQKWNVTSSGVFLSTNNYSARNFNLFVGSVSEQPKKYRKSVGLSYRSTNYSIDLLGLKYEIDHKNAIGYSIRYRYFSNKEGIPQKLAKADFHNYGQAGYVDGPIELKKLNFQNFSYLEHMFSYGRVLIDDRDRFLKVGGSFKLINGLNAEYFRAEGSIELDSPNLPTATFSSTNFQYGKAGNGTSLDSRKIGAGLDIGAVFEYRPSYGDYFYDMDGETNIERFDVPKYKYKLGVSITDIGWVKFNRAPTTQNFTTSSQVLPTAITGNLALPYDYIQAVVQPNSTVNDKQKEKFRMNLPTSLNIQFDYNLVKHFYLNYSSSLAIKFPNDPHRVHQKMINTITPRFEKQQLSVMMPLTLQRNGQFNVGLSARFNVKPVGFFIGSNNLTFLFGKRTIYTQNFFMGVSYSNFYKVPSDIDFDKVSDKMDDCMHDPGLWKFNGCPDTDGDGIPDKIDYCIYDAGPESTFGCPDRDEDGVIDLNDQCPDEKGLAIHYGCPDTDKDGVIDAADQCPDVPGVELNNGCPFELKSCCDDDDGDNIPNALDACPQVQGSIYNNGCPIDSSNLEIIPLKEAKDELDPNHMDSKVDSLTLPDPKPVIDAEDYKNIIKNDTEKARLNIFFDFDNAEIKPNYQTEIDKFLKKNSGKKSVYVIIGHTDSDGLDDYNLILSRKRAEIVKRTLINRGIDEDKIEVYYFGEWKPMKSNDNVIDRSFNRRVEVVVQ